MRVPMELNRLPLVMAGLLSRPSTPCLPKRRSGVDARDKRTGVRHGMCLQKRTALILLVFSWLRIIWTRKGINAVQHENIVFHGLLKHVPWAIFDRLVEQHDADRDERGVKSKAHLIAML